MLAYLQLIETEADKTKFEQLYIRYRKLMHYVANRILQNPYDAEDAVHMAFESIAKNMDKISAVNCPETRSLLVITTERRAIDIVRSRKTRDTLELIDDIAGIEIVVPCENPVAHAMANLPPQYREILLLRHDNGYTTKEIAKILGISTDAAQKTLWRAKEALREKLKESEVSI